MEYYSAIKKNTRMPFATTWMEPETLILSEVKSRKRETYTLRFSLFQRDKLLVTMTAGLPSRFSEPTK